MKNEGGGVFFILSLFRFSQSSSTISLTLLDFPPSSKRRRGSEGKVEGEVSAPPFSCFALHAWPCRFSLRFSPASPAGGSLTSPLPL